MSKMLVFGLVAAVTFGAWTRDAMAQRDAGAKARGDMRSFWDPAFQRSTNGGRYYAQPIVPRAVGSPSVESYRSFSYAPIELNAGDKVMVTGDNVKMMLGKEVVGSVPNGTEFQVTKVINGWLGAVIEDHGQKLNGWVWHNDVARSSVASEPRAAARQNLPVESARRFSYEPTQTAGSTQSFGTYQGGSSKEPWQYQKTDPRRYRPRGS